jgi:isoleucyl-tRNA synthetase
LEEFKGAALEGLDYCPPFDYFAHLKTAKVEDGGLPKLHTVLTSGYVKTDTGTGVVHQAPYFGEVWAKEDN